VRVEILKYTPEPEKLVALAARLCYSKSNIEELLYGVTTKPDIERFIQKLKQMRHLSPFEHISFTFGIEGISRVTSHQLVRHRIASYSQQSQRYVTYEDMEYVTPPSISSAGLEDKFVQIMEFLHNKYQEFISSGIPVEDARYILPNAYTTKIIVTMNARELMHFFRLRCCNRAQWEIRKMAMEMLKCVKDIAPVVFADAGPGCIEGECPEGELSCGKPWKKIEY